MARRKPWDKPRQKYERTLKQPHFGRGGFRSIWETAYEDTLERFQHLTVEELVDKRQSMRLLFGYREEGEYRGMQASVEDQGEYAGITELIKRSK